MYHRAKLDGARLFLEAMMSKTYVAWTELYELMNICTTSVFQFIVLIHGFILKHFIANLNLISNDIIQ